MKRQGALQKGITVFCGLLFLWFCIPIAGGLLGIGNGLGMAACVFLLWFSRSFVRSRIRLKNEPSRRNRRIDGMHRIILAFIILVVLIVTVFTGCMISAALRTPPPGATVVVLGSQVKGTEPSADLASRIRTAGVYLEQHPDAFAIASGGQGSGEAISEAAAIRQGLIQMGIDENRIFLEDKSVNTEENLLFSFQIVKEKGLSEQLAIVTDEYHQFRAGGLARRAGAQGYAVCAPTPWYIFPACHARELLALVKYFLF